MSKRSSSVKDFDEAVDQYIADLQGQANSAEAAYEAMIASMQALAAELRKEISQDRVEVDFSDDEDIPLISFAHKGGDVLADIRADSPRSFVFETYADFDELDSSYFERDYFIFSDLDGIAANLLERMVPVVARYEFACAQELDEEED